MILDKHKAEKLDPESRRGRSGKQRGIREDTNQLRGRSEKSGQIRVSKSWPRKLQSPTTRSLRGSYLLS